MNPKEQLLARISSFISGEDRSLRLAEDIESRLLEVFPDDERVGDLAEDLAQYRPEGGALYYGQPEMVEKLRGLLPVLASKL